MSEITERIFSELKRKGISGHALSRAVGLSSGVTSQWKARGNDPQAKHIAPIADFLGVSCRWVLTGEEEQTKLSYEEWEVLYLFNGMTSEGKERALEVLGFYASKYNGQRQEQLEEKDG